MNMVAAGVTDCQLIREGNRGAFMIDQEGGGGVAFWQIDKAAMFSPSAGALL